MSVLLLNANHNTQFTVQINPQKVVDILIEDGLIDERRDDEENDCCWITTDELEYALSKISFAFVLQNLYASQEITVAFGLPPAITIKCHRKLDMLPHCSSSSGG